MKKLVFVSCAGCGAIVDKVPVPCDAVFVCEECGRNFGYFHDGELGMEIPVTMIHNPLRVRLFRRFYRALGKGKDLPPSSYMDPHELQAMKLLGSMDGADSYRKRVSEALYDYQIEEFGEEIISFNLAEQILYTISDGKHDIELRNGAKGKVVALKVEKHRLEA